MRDRPPLIFVRHGETDWNRQARFQGQRDIPLNALGRRQAARNGRALAGILAERDWRLITSPLERSVETMRIVLAAAGQPDRPFEQDARLREVGYGEWEGFTLAEVNARFPDLSKARDLDKWGYVPPAGESYAMLATRAIPFFEALGAPALVVAHGGVLRALLHRFGSLPPHDAPHLAVPQDRVVLFAADAVLTV